MSFLKKLFGFGGNESGGQDAPANGPSQTHEGFTITATCYENNGRWQLSGVISKEIDGAVREHRFIRADSFATREDAEQMVFFKARQMIEQMGDRVLDKG